MRICLAPTYMDVPAVPVDVDAHFSPETRTEAAAIVSVVSSTISPCSSDVEIVSSTSELDSILSETHDHDRSDTSAPKAKRARGQFLNRLA